MKTLNKKTVSKMISNFDNELKHIIIADLKAIRGAKNQLMSSIKQGMEADKLSVA